MPAPALFRAPYPLSAWLLLGLLTACSRTPAPAPHEVAPPLPAAHEQPTVERAATPPSKPTPPSSPPAAEPPPTVPLDLSYRDTGDDAAVDWQATDASAYQQTRLPPLLNQGKDPGALSVRGKLLTDPERGTLIDSVDGAQLSVELKTR